MKQLLIVLFLFGIGISVAAAIKGEVAHPVKHYKYTYE
jgi:hypothetical protein